MDKQTLRSYRRLIREIDQLGNQRNWIRSQVARIDGGTSRGRGKSDPVSAAVIRGEKVDQELGRKLAELCSLALEIETAIDACGALQRAILRGRYIDGLSWEAIAVREGYSVQHIWRVHGAALQKMRVNASNKEV